nr:uncharacterized protein LOC115141286 [Oncorhynchus nerka]
MGGQVRRQIHSPGSSASLTVWTVTTNGRFGCSNRQGERLVPFPNGTKHQRTNFCLVGPIKTLLSFPDTSDIPLISWSICPKKALSDCVKDLLYPFQKEAIDLVVCIDAMGFILGSAVATTLGKGFLAICKAGHLHIQTQSQEYSDSSDREKMVEVRLDVLRPGADSGPVDRDRRNHEGCYQTGGATGSDCCRSVCNHSARQ